MKPIEFSKLYVKVANETIDHLPKQYQGVLKEIQLKLDKELGVI